MRKIWIMLALVGLLAGCSKNAEVVLMIISEKSKIRLFLIVNFILFEFGLMCSGVILNEDSKLTILIESVSF